MYYLLWFYIGNNINTIISTMKRLHIWNKRIIILLFLLQLALFQVNESLDISLPVLKLISVCLESIILPFLMFVVLNYIVLAIPISSSLAEWIGKVSEYCFGIYLYAEPLNYLLLFLFNRLFGLYAFGREWMALGLYLTRVIVTPLFAVGIVKVLMKLKLENLY